MAIEGGPAIIPSSRLSIPNQPHSKQLSHLSTQFTKNFLGNGFTCPETSLKSMPFLMDSPIDQEELSTFALAPLTESIYLFSSQRRPLIRTRNTEIGKAGHQSMA